MKDAWNIIQTVFTCVGGLVGHYLGGVDGFLIALIAFVITDYITGIMCGITSGQLSSEIGFKGIFKKMIIFLLVGIAHLIDANIIQDGNILRTAIIFFYISNEGISILENTTKLGMPVPIKLRKILKQLKDTSESEDK